MECSTTRGREITVCVLDRGAKLVTIYVAGSRRGKLAALVATWRQAIATGRTNLPIALYFPGFGDRFESALVTVPSHR